METQNNNKMFCYQCSQTANEEILKVLTDDYGIRLISSPKEDIDEMLKKK